MRDCSVCQKPREHDGYQEETGRKQLGRYKAAENSIKVKFVMSTEFNNMKSQNSLGPELPLSRM